MSEDYKEEREQIKKEQEDMSYDEIKERLSARNKFLLELDHMVPQEHIWVDRGGVMSCEGAAHPNHRAYKRR